MKTLAIVSHPYASQSRIINALQQTASEADNVIVRNLETLYGNDVDTVPADKVRGTSMSLRASAGASIIWT